MSENINDNEEIQKEKPIEPVANSVIAARLSIAKTIDTTLSEEEEKMYEKAAKESRETSDFHKKQWIGFTIMMIFMTALLIWLLTVYIKF